MRRRLPVPASPGEGEPGTLARMRRALGARARSGVVLVLDAAGVAGLLYTASLVSTVLAWGLGSIVVLGLAALIDRE